MMKGVVSLSFSIKNTKLPPLRISDKSVLSSGELGSLVKTDTCMNAALTYVPPILVFPRSNMKAELLDNVCTSINSGLS